MLDRICASEDILSDKIERTSKLFTSLKFIPAFCLEVGFRISQKKMTHSAKEEALKLTSFWRELPQILAIALPTPEFSAKGSANSKPCICLQVCFWPLLVSCGIVSIAPGLACRRNPGGSGISSTWDWSVIRNALSGLAVSLFLDFGRGCCAAAD